LEKLQEAIKNLALAFVACITEIATFVLHNDSFRSDQGLEDKVSFKVVGPDGAVKQESTK
jgi:hypothetical protein